MGYIGAFAREALMEYKSGFIYLKSASINQMIAISKKTWQVFCEDSVVYSQNEVRLFMEANAEIPLMVHTIKKVFGGEVVSIERELERDVQAKRIEGSGAGGDDNNPPAIGSLPPPPEKSEGSGNGQLDIF
jgi:hypothetical protein